MQALLPNRLEADISISFDSVAFAKFDGGPLGKFVEKALWPYFFIELFPYVLGFDPV